MKKRIVPFSITKDDTPEALSKRMIEFSLKMFLDLEIGDYQLEITKPMRTLKQNNTIHAIFDDIANTMTEHGLDHHLNIRARPTAENIKTFLIENFLNGRRTSETSSSELAKALDLLLESFNEFFISKGIETIEIKQVDLTN